MKQMDKKATILAVDDTRQNLDIIISVLSGEYRILGAINGQAALKTAKKQQPDLILLDIMMPDMDGYAVCKQLKADAETSQIPVIFLTAKTETVDEIHGFELGAVDYITKPIIPPTLISRVKAHLSLRNYSSELEHQVAQRTHQLVQIQDATMLSMAALAEQRDPDTGNHIRRTQSYVQLLALHLQRHPRFTEQLTAEAVELMHKAAPLHDIGKVSIPDHVLNKPGKLTSKEFELMKEHALAGKEVIDVTQQSLDEEQPFLRYAGEIAWCHHEKWDGSGYPQGLSGDEIPLSARLMALADVYDALVSKRCYKPAFSFEQAETIICEGRGSHFDPDVVDAFVTLKQQFQQVAEQYSDE